VGQVATPDLELLQGIIERVELTALHAVRSANRDAPGYDRCSIGT
jgi:hypothetical protein